MNKGVVVEKSKQVVKIGSLASSIDKPSVGKDIESIRIKGLPTHFESRSSTNNSAVRRYLSKVYGIHLQRMLRHVEKTNSSNAYENTLTYLQSKKAKGYIFKGVLYKSLEPILQGTDLTIAEVVILDSVSDIQAFLDEWSKTGKIPYSKLFVNTEEGLYVSAEAVIKAHKLDFEEYIRLVAYGKSNLERELSTRAVTYGVIPSKVSYGLIKSHEWSVLVNRVGINKEELAKSAGFDELSRLHSYYNTEDSRYTVGNSKVIVFDIDGVITSNDALYACLEKEYPSFKRKHLTRYNLKKALLENGVIQDDSEHSDKSFFSKYGSEIFETTTSVNYVVNFIHWCINVGLEVHFVTARGVEEEPRTRNLFNMLGIPFINVHHIGSQDKVEYCLEFGTDILIEDRASNALKALELGIKPLLVSYTYNEYVKNIKRINDFSDMWFILKKGWLDWEVQK